jgi:hypothetical protein
VARLVGRSEFCREVLQEIVLYMRGNFSVGGYVSDTGQVYRVTVRLSEGFSIGHRVNLMKMGRL